MQNLNLICILQTEGFNYKYYFECVMACWKFKDKLFYSIKLSDVHFFIYTSNSISKN